MKKGPPITESITPTGITIGANNVLPTVSANSIKNAPNTPEQGISFLTCLERFLCLFSNLCDNEKIFPKSNRLW